MSASRRRLPQRRGASPPVATGCAAWPPPAGIPANPLADIASLGLWRQCAPAAEPSVVALPDDADLARPVGTDSALGGDLRCDLDLDLAARGRCSRSRAGIPTFLHPHEDPGRDVLAAAQRGHRAGIAGGI